MSLVVASIPVPTRSGLHVHRVMYERFFEERRRIPDGHFHEVCFEELEKGPIGPLRNIYEALDLPAFANVKSR